MASEIRVNSITNRSGLGTVTFSDTGVVLSGVSTFSTGIVVAAGSASAPSITPTGDSNTGIFFPSADTIAFAEGGAEALRIDSNANIGIGTNNPTKLLHLSQNSDVAIRMHSGNCNVDARSWEIVVGGNPSNNAEMVFRTRNDAGTGGTEIARFTTAGNIAFQSGKGIDFSATSQAGGMTSELLADYEEGTWTPGISDSATGTKTVSGSQGWYTKIGRMVYLGFALNNLNSSTSGDSYITGIPFTSAAINQVGTCFIADVSGVTYASGYSDIYGRINSSTNAIQLLQKTINGNAHDTMSGGSLGTGLVLRGMCMYIV